METTGKIGQIKVTENSLFFVVYCSRVANVPPQRARIRSTALILPNDSRG